jgi:hypothetical protein
VVAAVVVAAFAAITAAALSTTVAAAVTTAVAAAVTTAVTTAFATFAAVGKGLGQAERVADAERQGGCKAECQGGHGRRLQQAARALRPHVAGRDRNLLAVNGIHRFILLGLGARPARPTDLGWRLAKRS